METRAKKKSKEKKEEIESESEEESPKKKKPTPKKQTKKRKTKKDESEDEEESGSDDQPPKKKATVYPDTYFDLTDIPGSEELTQILAFDPATIPTKEEFGAAFGRIANQIMNHYLMYIRGAPHRLCELEFYFCGDKHMDTFTHQDELQKTFGNWYFHKSGSGYKGGSYKGLDITFGQKGFGGILIRAIEPINDDYIEGPSMVVDRILSINRTKNGIPEIADYVENKTFNRSICKKGTLYLEKSNSLEERDIIAGPRFGLTLKKSDAEKPYYIMKPYRFMSHPENVKKGKPNLVLGLHLSGKSIEDIITTSNSKKNIVNGYINSFDDGKSKTLEFYKAEDLKKPALLFGLAGFLSTQYKI